MMSSRGLFGWSPPHVQPLTPVSEVSEPPESPSPYMDSGGEAVLVEDDVAVDEMEEIEPPLAAVPFSKLFACADELDWVLMVVGAVAAAAHGMALVIYLHFFGRAINLLDSQSDELFSKIKLVCWTLVLHLFYLFFFSLFLRFFNFDCLLEAENHPNMS